MARKMLTALGPRKPLTEEQKRKREEEEEKTLKQWNHAHSLNIEEIAKKFGVNIKVVRDESFEEPLILVPVENKLTQEQLDEWDLHRCRNWKAFDETDGMVNYAPIMEFEHEGTISRGYYQPDGHIPEDSDSENEAPPKNPKYKKIVDSVVTRRPIKIPRGWKARGKSYRTITEELGTWYLGPDDDTEDTSPIEEWDMSVTFMLPIDKPLLSEQTMFDYGLRLLGGDKPIMLGNDEHPHYTYTYDIREPKFTSDDQHLDNDPLLIWQREHNCIDVYMPVFCAIALSFQPDDPWFNFSKMAENDWNTFKTLFGLGGNGADCKYGADGSLLIMAYGPEMKNVLLQANIHYQWDAPDTETKLLEHLRKWIADN